MQRILYFRYFLVFLSATFLTVLSAPIPHYDLSKRQTTGGKLVFSHFMIGIVSDRTSASDYDADMQRAKSYGIDAFALNIGVDDYTDTQLEYAYESAANNDMKVFLSFDFNWWDSTDASGIGSKIAQYGSKSAQLTINGKVFVSSFSGTAAVPRVRVLLDIVLGFCWKVLERAIRHHAES